MNDSYPLSQDRGQGQVQSSSPRQSNSPSQSKNPSQSNSQRPQSPQDLALHVAHSTGLDEATATRVVADVAAYFGQTVEEYVRQRHEQLKSRNHKNDDIWPLIAEELSYRRFKADELTPRQLRRIIYG